jgi:formate transporter
LGLFVKSGAADSFWRLTGASTGDYADLTWTHAVLGNLLPVTLGNVFGGSVMVGLVYWLVYRRPGKA